MEKLSRICETDNSLKAGISASGSRQVYRFIRWHCVKMRRLSALYCPELRTYLTVFVLVGKCCAMWDWRVHGINTSQETSILIEDNLQQDRSPETPHLYTMENEEYTNEENFLKETNNDLSGLTQNLFTSLDISVDVSLASSNSCQRINETIYYSQAKRISVLSRTTSEALYGNHNVTIGHSNEAQSNAEVLEEIITELQQTSNVPQEDPKLVTLNFLVNETEIGNKSRRGYTIFRCNFTINHTNVITRMSPQDDSIRSRIEPRNVSLTFRFLGSHESDQFNLRNLVEDLDRFVGPSFCSSKIPFFYSLVITGDLKTNSLLLMFISFNYVLSICSLSLIFLTAKLSHEWRQRRSNIILINFTVAIFLQIILHFVSDILEVDEGICTTITILCHYFTLVQFFWTSTIAYMQYRRYVQVFDEKDSFFLIKLIIFAWSIPALVISASIILVFSLHENSTNCVDKYKICSLINTYLLKYSVSLPLMFTLLINFVFFILIFRHLLRRKPEFDQRARALVEAKLAFVLFFLLDLNLIVAIIADMFSIDILAVIFVTSHSLQGVLLFLVFVVRNKCSRKMYVRWLKMAYNRMPLPI